MRGSGGIQKSSDVWPSEAAFQVPRTTVKIPHDCDYHQPEGTSRTNAARPQGAAGMEGTGLLERRWPQTSVRVPRLRHGCHVVGEYHRGYHSGWHAGWPVNGGGKRPGGVHARVSCGRGMSELDLPWAEWGEGAGSGPGRTDPGPEGEEPSSRLSGCPRSKFQRKKNGKLFCRPLRSPSFPSPPSRLPSSFPSLLPFFVEILEYAHRIYSSPRFVQKSSFPTLPCIQHPFSAAVSHFANSFHFLPQQPTGLTG